MLEIYVYEEKHSSTLPLTLLSQSRIFDLERHVLSKHRYLH